jgi:hypothetical protein
VLACLLACLSSRGTGASHASLSPPPTQAELITVTADEGARAIIATWRLEGAVNLPFKPKIPPYVVTTTLGVDDAGLICSQVGRLRPSLASACSCAAAPRLETPPPSVRRLP